MSLEQLLQIVPAPADPVATGSRERWYEVEARLGSQLPTDYKNFIATYGAGEFRGFLGVLSPYSRRSNLLDRHNQLRHIIEQEAGLDFPILFPKTSGLLLCGADENGNQLFWRTGSSPETWPVVYASAEFLDVDEYQMTLTDFLVEWLTGRVCPKAIAGFRYRQPVTFVTVHAPA